MDNTFVTASGVILNIKPVNRLALQDLLHKLGIQSAAASNDIRKTLQTDDAKRQAQISTHILQLFNYAFGAGVANNPDDEAMAQLEFMGFDVKPPIVARVNWLRYIVFADEQEAALALRSIIDATFGIIEDVEESED